MKHVLLLFPGKLKHVDKKLGKFLADSRSLYSMLQKKSDWAKTKNSSTVILSISTSIIPGDYCLLELMYWVKSGWMSSSFADGRWSFTGSRQRNIKSRSGGDNFSGIGGVDWALAIWKQIIKSL